LAVGPGLTVPQYMAATRHALPGTRTGGKNNRGIRG